MQTTNGDLENVYQPMIVKKRNGATLQVSVQERLFAQQVTVFIMNGLTEEDKVCVLQLQNNKTAEDRDTAIGKEGVLEIATVHLIHIFKYHLIKLSSKSVIRFQKIILIMYRELCVRHVH